MHFIGSQIKFPLQPKKDYTQSIKQNFQLREENPNNLLHETVGKSLYSFAFKP